MKNEKGFIKVILMLIIIALIGILVFFGYAMYSEFTGEGTIILGNLEVTFPSNENREQINNSNLKIDNTIVDYTDNTLTGIKEYENRYLYKQLSSSEKLIYSKLYDNIEYEQTFIEPNIYNIYGALVSKTCVCEGYAKALQYLLNEVELENVIVTGTATNNDGKTESHAWNYVKIDDEWYAIDTTWDDPIIVGGGKLTDKIKYRYFLKGSSTMSKNHFISAKFTADGQDFEVPKLSITDYNM